MDPLSITAGVLALLGACITTGVALKEFYDGAATANIKIKGLLTDVESFTQVLRLMKDTLEQENIQASLQSTGHIGNHWSNLSTSIRDGQSTLCQLQETIEKANKSVSLLDGPRRHLRLKGAADEIAVYQQQIRSYRDTLQLSLQTVILWNQVTVRESTDKILPNLDEIQQAIRRIAFDINDRISGLQNVIESKSSDHELRSLNNLRNCVKSAASVVSSASTTLGVENSARLSTYGSEFGDCFPPEPSETMLRWISSNTVHEFEEEKDTESSLSGPKPASGKSLELVEESQESDQSDSDGELEAEIIQSLLRRGKDKLASRDFEDAERHFRNCLTRASSNGSTISLHRLVGPTSEIMTLLLTTYRHQEKWDEAHSLLIEKIAVESRGSSKANQGVLADMLILVEVLLQKSAYAEALLHGRRALKSYRKLGSEGTLGVQDSLRLLCQVSKAAGNHDEEDAYNAILSDILQQSVQKPAFTQVSTGHDSEPTTSPTTSTIKGEGLIKEANTQNLGNPDTLDSNSSWFSGDQLTPSSATRTHHRGSSLSSLGSAGPASPNTIYTSSSSASREGSSALKESPPLNPAETCVSEPSPLLDPTKTHLPESSPLSRLEGAFGQLKAQNDSLPLPKSKCPDTVTVAPESSQVNDISNPQDAAATDGPSAAPSPPSNLLKRQKSRIPQSMVNHFQKNLEEAAIKYFREKKGNPPKPVIPTPRIPLPVSDYELPQWIGTLQLELGPAELPTVSLDPLEKSIQKSKSATDLFDLGVVELPAESLQKSKSATNLHDWSAIPSSDGKFDPAKTSSAINEEDDWDAIYRPPNKSSPPGTERPDGTKNASALNDRNDWDAIFATLDTPVLAGPSTGNMTQSKNPPNYGIALSAAPSRPETGTSLLDVDTYDEPILKEVNIYDGPILNTLVGMGYPRSKALDALEKCEYNLERAADHLITESSREPNLSGSQTKHNRSKSASSTSKEKHMGVQDFRFFVTPVPETAEDSSVPTGNVQPSSSFGPPTRPISFQTLVQLQSKRISAGSYLDRPSPTGLMTRRSEPNMTEQARSHKKSFSLQDELPQPGQQIRESQPRNPIATYFDVKSYLPVELPADQPFVANDLSTDFATIFPSKSEETGPSNRPSLYESQGASTGGLSTTPAVTFSEILTDRDAIRRKLVIAGDPFCGKSSLCSVFSKNVYPETYRSTELETGIGHIDVNGKRVELVLWDTGGDYNISGIRLQCYPDSHVVLICFTIDSPDSLDNAEELFTKELQKAYNCSARYMLVGLKGDLRYDWDTMKRLKITDQHPVTGDEARAVALRIGAAKYVECSAKTGECVKDVFDAAARLALMPNEKIKKMRSLRRLFGKE